MVVRMRSTRSHTGNRRSHHALKAPQIAVCGNCGGNHRPHHMCLECGFYKGRQVMDMKAEKAAREARIQAKKAARNAQAASGADAPEESQPAADTEQK